MRTKARESQAPTSEASFRPTLDNYASICANDLEALHSASDRNFGWYYESARVCLHWAIVRTSYPGARLILAACLFLILLIFADLALWQVSVISLLVLLALHPLLMFALFRWRARSVYERISQQQRAKHARREEVNAAVRRFCGSSSNPLL